MPECTESLRKIRSHCLQAQSSQYRAAVQFCSPNKTSRFANWSHKSIKMSKSRSSKKQVTVIEPNKCIVEDLEVLAFESEEQLNLYSIWHESLVDRRQLLKASSEREKQIIRNEIARKTRMLIRSVEVKPVEVPTIRPSRSLNQSTFSSHQRQGAVFPPKGLQVFNSAQNNGALPISRLQGLKYKLTKLYNKYRGRQTRRNFVLDKQRNSRIDQEISKSYLNPWMAYTALQALRLPETNITSLNTATSNSSKILTPLAQPMASTTVPCSSPATKAIVGKKGKAVSKKKQQQQQQHQQQLTQQPQPQSLAPPMHLVYIDPVNLITYSNRINPQQVADYRQKSHLLPSSATSKKSSAASYDVYEIMEVLANTNKTNVTITRNANRSSSAGSNASVYSHSVNANTPGIVSTQLHLQARSYLDSMGKFYAEEAERLTKEQERLEQEPSHEEMIARYLYV